MCFDFLKVNFSLAKQLDPNAPRPEGNLMAPITGEELLVCFFFLQFLQMLFVFNYKQNT